VDADAGRTRVCTRMATFDGSDFVEEQLRSIVTQLNDTDEVVVVDDASSDDTIERIDSPCDPRGTSRPRSPARSHGYGVAARYVLTVGGIATLVSVLIFNDLVHGYVGGPGPMPDQPLVAFVLANLVGMLVGYRSRWSWAFRPPVAFGVDGGRVGSLVINVVSIVLPLACLTLTRYALGRSGPIADNVAANVVGLGLDTLTLFWAIRTFIFISPVGVEPRELVRHG